MATRQTHTGTPNPLHSLLEWRVLAEAAMLPFTWPLLARAAPRGDGHPVLLLPGFLGDEGSLVALKLFLAGRGYDVQTWGLGRNLGFQPRHAQALEQKIRHLHHQTGRPVSLVGWSLGGVFARCGALQAPDCVRQVITLGSPLNVDAEGSQSPALVRAIYRLVARPMESGADGMPPQAQQLREHPLPSVPISCLWSASDGVVPPQEATIQGDPARCENIRVAGSHTGLGFNPMVLAIVANRLAQPEGHWSPFKPAGMSGAAYRLMTHAALPA